MRLVSWVFGPMSMHPYNFESFCTSLISVIVIMPVNWQEKVRASTKKSATVKIKKRMMEFILVCVNQRPLRVSL